MRCEVKLGVPHHDNDGDKKLGGDDGGHMMSSSLFRLLVVVKIQGMNLRLLTRFNASNVINFVLYNFTGIPYLTYWNGEDRPRYH